MQPYRMMVLFAQRALSGLWTLNLTTPFRLFSRVGLASKTLVMSLFPLKRSKPLGPARVPLRAAAEKVEILREDQTV